MRKIELNRNDIDYVVKKVNSILNENVYISNIDKKKKNASITYKTGRASGNLMFSDMLTTDKMDAENSDTYEVPLKGGVISYNITSIRGVNVMHYFKQKFSNGPIKATINDEEYNLIMEDNIFREFMERFTHKVGLVVEHCSRRYENTEADFKPHMISIYPVQSSSNFNETMAKLLTRENIAGLPIQTINKDLLLKDLRLHQKDDEFIGKNKEFYSSKMATTDTIPGTVEQNVDADILKYGIHSKLSSKVIEINNCVDKLLHGIYNYRNAIKRGDNPVRLVKALAKNYKEYADALNTCKQIATYVNPARGNVETSSQLGEFLSILHYSKGPSIEKRSDDVWSLVKPFVRSEVSPVNGKPYTKEDLQKWEPMKFQIKSLSNGERMGLKNIYNPNTDTELVRQEVEKAKNTIFVIFDDNVSGGATLSDVCLQCKQLGIKHIVPITFGKMSEKWTAGRVALNFPTNNAGEKKKFNFQQ